MALLTWDGAGERLFETGIDKCVLYPYNTSSKKYTPGVAWNGITAISEKPSGAEATKLYADNTKYLNLYSAEEFGATIEAYMYPSEFEACDGTAPLAKGAVVGQQTRKTFGLCYRTLLGNDTEGQDYGYKLHLIYGCQASPSEKSFQTVNDSPEAITFSWELTTTPVNVDGLKPTSIITINSKDCDSAKLAALEKILYGVDADAENSVSEVIPELPTPAKIVEVLGVAAAG